mgnify:FL=1
MLKSKFKILFLFCTLLGQNQSLESISDSYSNYGIPKDKYVTDKDGSILMKVNVWGQVIAPGVHLVQDGIDLATLISIVGGPNDGANLKGIRLYREMPDKGEKLVHNINFQDFIDTGNRSNFIKIKPNDTIIIPQKTSHLILKQVGTINTIFSAVMIYLQIRYLANSQ